MGVRLLTEIGKAIEARSNLIRDNKPDCENMPALIFEPASWMSFVGEVMNIPEAEEALRKYLIQYNGKTNSMINGTDYEMQQWVKAKEDK
tara:strand:- start:888 stop:1157 length:270 start_codon:yes stop_codon:yes gene_type:complete